MKKLTAGIFATLLAVVSADGAYAAIASKGYVDDKVGTVTTALGNKADKTELGKYATTEALTSGLAGKLDTTGIAAKATADAAGKVITDTYATKTELGKKADSATVTALDSAAEKIANRVTTVSDASDNTHYPTAKAVWDVVQAETSDIASSGDLSALTTRVGTLETASANHVVKNEAITGGTHTKITYDAKGLVTAGANLTADDIPEIPNTKVSGLGSLATKSSVATTDIASKAVTKEKLADDIVTSLGKADTALQKTTADGLYAVKSLETQVGTVSKENMGTTTATTVVGGVKEAINAAKAAASAASTADDKAVAAQDAAEAAQADVDALETTVSGQGTRLTAAEGDIDTIQTKISSMATSDTVTKLTERVTTAEGGITALETAVNDAESGLAATNAIADNALSTAQSAKTTADAALPKTTYNSQVGTVSATNMGTTASTVVTAIKEVKTQADKGVSDAATAKSAADAAQETATQAKNDAATAQEAAETAQTTAEARIPKPSGECSNPTAKCVLVSNGTNSFEWEVIARDGEGK